MVEKDGVLIRGPNRHTCGAEPGKGSSRIVIIFTRVRWGEGVNGCHMLFKFV